MKTRPIVTIARYRPRTLTAAGDTAMPTPGAVGPVERDASGGLLDQDYEMFEQQSPHTLMKHEYLTDSAGAGEWRGGGRQQRRPGPRKRPQS